MTTTNPAVRDDPSDPPAISDSDRDSLFILPLAIIPFQTASLKRSRLIKNVGLDSVIEVFNDIKAGSGQIDLEAAQDEFGWPDIPPHPDLQILRKLAPLHSFDVYSLRISLREQGINVNSVDALRLSRRKNKELTSYMSQFTRPLIHTIYGDDVSVQTFEDIILLFRQPDVSKALEKLRMMTQRLEIGIEEIPKFLEDYGDIFLSLSYYRQCLDHIEPTVSDFLDWLDEADHSWQFRNNASFGHICALIRETLNGSMVAITGRLEDFDRSTKDLWDDVSAARFRRVEQVIKSYHTAIGGVLCALTVKMESWSRFFPHKRAGGPARRAEFIMSQMRQGIENIHRIEDSDTDAGGAAFAEGVTLFFR